MEIGIILLAAGSSSRMGRSKQMLLVKDQPLLLRSTTVAIQSGMLPVVVVLGANEKEHRAVLADLTVNITVNQNWKSGMGGSLKVGLNYLLKHAPKAEAVLMMVCDQPLLTTAHLKKIKEKYLESKKRIVASHYSGTAGVPALFHKTLFSEILDLPDDNGARKIIQQHPKDVLAVDFPDGSVDLDTPDDYNRFTK